MDNERLKVIKEALKAGGLTAAVIIIIEAVGFLNSINDDRYISQQVYAADRMIDKQEVLKELSTIREDIAIIKSDLKYIIEGANHGRFNNEKERY